jgi:hypothetical protein
MRGASNFVLRAHRDVIRRNFPEDHGAFAVAEWWAFARISADFSQARAAVRIPVTVDCEPI